MLTLEFINEFNEALTKQFLQHRRAAMAQLSAKFPDQFALAISIAITFPLPRITPQFKLNYTELNVAKTFGNLLYYANQRDTKMYKVVFYTMPLAWQVFVNNIGTGVLRSKIGEDKLLESVSTIMSRSELLVQFELPDVFTSSDTLVIQGLSREEVVQDRYPIQLLGFPKDTSRANLYYLIRENGKVVSNCVWKIVRDYVIHNLPVADGGVIFYVFKSSKHKNKYNILSLLISDTRTVKAVYKGNSNLVDVDFSLRFKDTYTNQKISVIAPKTLIVTNGEEFVKALNPTKFKTYISVNSQGISRVNFNYETSTVAIKDWWYDEEFNPLGCVTEYGNIRFNIPNNLLSTGFTDRTLKIKMTKYGDKVLATDFLSVSHVWNTKYKHCCKCGLVKHQHSVGGLCSKCVRELSEVLEWKNSEVVLGECVADFTTVLKNFVLEGKDNRLTIYPLKGVQYNLELY